MKFRTVIRGVLAALVGAAWACSAISQSYPSRPVKIIVPYSAGGQPDVATRTLAQEFSSQLGQSFIVENVPGSSGFAAINALLNAPADGYTLMSADAGHWAINRALMKKLPYDPERDFAPIGLYGETAGLFLAVHQSVSARTMQDLIALAKAKPGTLSYASAGVGSIHHLIMEDLKGSLGVDILHVPYKGSAQAVPALVGGQVSMAIASLAAISTFVKNGQLRLLAVSVPKRSSFAPDVPTMAEAAGLPDFGHASGSGLIARSGTPPAVIGRVSAAAAQAVKQQQVIARFATVGMVPSSDVSPKYLAEKMQRDYMKYSRIVKASGIQAR